MSRVFVPALDIATNTLQRVRENDKEDTRMLRRTLLVLTVLASLRPPRATLIRRNRVWWRRSCSTLKNTVVSRPDATAASFIQPAAGSGAEAWSNAFQACSAMTASMTARPSTASSKASWPKGGDPTGTGEGGSKYPNVPAEFSQTPRISSAARLGAARTSEPDSGQQPVLHHVRAQRRASGRPVHVVRPTSSPAWNVVDKPSSAAIRDEQWPRRQLPTKS